MQDVSVSSGFPETQVTAGREVYNHDEARECLVEVISNRGRWVLAYEEIKKGKAMDSCCWELN